VKIGEHLRKLSQIKQGCRFWNTRYVYAASDRSHAPDLGVTEVSKIDSTWDKKDSK